MGKAFNIIIFLALIGVTALVWNRPADRSLDDLSEEERQEHVLDKYGNVVDESPDILKRDQERFFTRMGMGLVCTVYAGILASLYILPVIAHKATHVAYDSGEQVGPDPMHDARAALAQGDYQRAVDKFREGAKNDPTNRMPHIEIAKVQREHLNDVDAAIESLRNGLESQEWRENDAAFFMFRISELYQNDKQDNLAASEVLKQIIELFPETRHAANATHKLREMGTI